MRRKQMINKELTKLYDKYWPELLSFRKKYNLSGPLLMNLRTRKIKLFIIGHETHGNWDGNLEELRKDYNFALNTCLRQEPPPKEGFHEWEKIWHTYNSDFWETIRKLKAKFITNSEEGIAWSNLNRFDDNGSPPKKDIEKEMIKKFPLLIEEIKICKPKIIIILTWDGTYILRKTYASIGNVGYEKVPRIDENELLRVKIPEFEGKAYEIHHPRYIEGWGKNKVKYNTNELIKTIVKDYKSNH